MEFYYDCKSDGKQCHKEKVNVIDGKLHHPCNEYIKSRYKNKVSEETLNKSWDVCDFCNRNHTADGFCHGILKIKY